MTGDILSARFRNIFEESLSPVQQRQAVDALKDYIAELNHGTDEQRRDLGLLGDDEADQLDEKALQAALERCYWQLVMFLRFSRPSRIAEAEPYLRLIFSKIHARPTPSPAHLHEIHTALYLAVALASPPPVPSTPVLRPSKPTLLSAPNAQPSPYSATTTPNSSLPNSPPPELASGQAREIEALSLFTRAFAAYDGASTAPSPQKTPEVPAMSHMRLSPGLHPHNGAHAHHAKVLGPKTELWARAAYASLLRRLGRHSEADGVMHVIRSYITQHPYALPSEKYDKLLQDIEHEFGISLLDATLSLETDVALGVTVGKKNVDIQYVEDAANGSEDVSDGEKDDSAGSEDSDELDDEPPVLTISPPSSSSESDSDTESSTESLTNSPITPAAHHFTAGLPHVKDAAEDDADMVDRLSSRVGALGLSGAAIRAHPRSAKDEDDAAEQLARVGGEVRVQVQVEAALMRSTTRPYVVRYGAL
ncbi:hypothetical protein EIP86_001962 [Pleurotus ostreatoroseus]|nr:hypothetical protein EIP86_001962 [Pleurotus ostreatoroseus]